MAQDGNAATSSGQQTDLTTKQEQDEEVGQDSVGELAPTLSTKSSARSILKGADGHHSTAQDSSSGVGSGEGLPTKRSVSWNDFQGKSLAAVKEFTPSESNSSEAELDYELPHDKGACCVIC